MAYKTEAAGRLIRPTAEINLSSSYYRNPGKSQGHSAREITQCLSGRWCGRYGLIPGPGHSQHDRSLQICDGDNGRLIVHSFAGDDWRDCMAYLKACGFSDDAGQAREFRQNLSQPVPVRQGTPDLEKVAFALEISKRARPAAGTIVETYLRRRSVSLPSHAPLFFHPDCPRGSERLPAMVATMTDAITNEPTGIHRTFLKPDGSGKVDSEPQKAMLGRYKGAVVRLTSDENVTTGLGICEGIETGLSVLLFGWAPMWAALSDNGIRDFPILTGIECLTIFADHDANGAGLNAAHACAARWLEAGREVFIRTPAVVGKDWNNVVCEAMRAQ